MNLVNEVIDQEFFVFKENATPMEQSQFLIDQCFPGATKMHFIKYDGEYAEADIPFAQENRALHGFMHGGAFFTVGDTITAFMCMHHVQNQDERMLTMDASIRYLRPIKKDTVKVKAHLSKKDKNILYFICDFYNENGKRAAQAKYKYVITRPKS